MSSDGANSDASDQRKAASDGANYSESVWVQCARNGGLTELHMVIPDTQRKRILCICRGGTWILPKCVGEYAVNQLCQKVVAEAQKNLGFKFDIRVLRYVWNREQDVEIDRCSYTISRAVAVFECDDDPLEIPEGWEWVDIHEANIEHPEDEIRRAIDQELDDMRHGRERKFRFDWGRPGWFRDTSKWMCAVLRSHGLEVEESVVQFRSPSNKTVLRARTKTGDYFLTCSPAFCNEAAITEVLCKAAPEYVEKPLLIDAERRITISADHGKELGLFGENRVAQKDLDKFFRDLARFQHATSKVMDKLEAAGLKVYRAEWMEENLDALLEHEEVAFMKGTDEFEKVRSHKTDIFDALRDLRNSNWPTTFVHNDFLEANILGPGREEGPFRFFDWGESFGGCAMFELLGIFSSEMMRSYFEEMSALFGFSLEECNCRTFEIARALAGCFAIMNKIETVEHQAKVGEYYYLEQRFRLLWLTIRNSKLAA